MNEGTPEEVLKKIFRVFDVNGDGSITMKEMTKLIKVSQWSLVSIGLAYDYDD